MYLQSMEEDDGMQWEEDFTVTPIQSSVIPDALHPGSLREHRTLRELREHVTETLKVTVTYRSRRTNSTYYTAKGIAKRLEGYRCN